MLRTLKTFQAGAETEKNNLSKAFIIYYKLIKSFNYLTFKKTK